MSASQLGGAIALAVIGFLLVVISAMSRDSIGEMTPFANKLSKGGLFIGAAFMLPLLLILLVGIAVGFSPA